MFNVNYNPDVLTCLANLSNDEVFTPPDVANKMLDQLPQDLWNDKNITFLDPCTKSGIFLREITKRLLVGLEDEIPDLQERINHILTKQVFGIGITELTALLTRRSLYCSKNANQEFSITDAFSNNDGNILYKNIEHKWKNLKCEYCGASKNLFNRKDFLEQHAYNFIHTNKPEELFKMKFDVIIGNPPYQMNVGVEQKNFAISLYHKFVEQSIKLSPRYLSMIIPARWYAGGRGLDDFREKMINDTRISKLFDFPDPSVCFPGVQIKGGVCYFLWERDYDGKCEVFNYSESTDNKPSVRFLKEKDGDSFIRYNDSISIMRKTNLSNESFKKYISSQTPFGIITSFNNFKKEKFNNSIKFYSNKVEGYVDIKHVTKNHSFIPEYKVLLSSAYGAGEGFPHQIINKPFIAEPNSCCSQTYLVIGPFSSKKRCENVISYMKTKFFRFHVMMKKNAQHNMKDVFSFVPIQNFDEEWTDEKLFKKYKLNEDEINFIEKNIKSID